MSTTKKQDLATLQPEAVLNAVADEDELLSFLGENAKDGRENIKSDDISIPRLAILQPTSPQTQDRESKAYAGDIYDVLNKVNYGPNGLKFIPLYFFQTRTKWLTRDPGAPIECISKDGEHGSKYGACMNCKFTQWSEEEGLDAKDRLPACTEFKNILLVPLPDGEDYRNLAPLVYSAKRTAIGPMKQMLTAMQSYRFNGREVPMYARTWVMKVVKKENDSGTFYVPQFEGLDLIRQVPMLKYFKGLYESMKASQTKFDIQQEEDVVDAAYRPAADQAEY